MSVAQILAAKGSDVFTVQSGTTVLEVAKALAEKKIGAAVVLQDDELCGIASERDIVRELGKRGAPCLTDEVSALMTAKLITCTPADQADAVLEKMTEGRFRHMPVLEDGKMIGLISIGDMVKARLSELAMEKDALQGMIMGH